MKRLIFLGVLALLVSPVPSFSSAATVVLHEPEVLLAPFGKDKYVFDESLVLNTGLYQQGLNVGSVAGEPKGDDLGVSLTVNGVTFHPYTLTTPTAPGYAVSYSTGPSATGVSISVNGRTNYTMSGAALTGPLWESIVANDLKDVMCTFGLSDLLAAEHANSEFQVVIDGLTTDLEYRVQFLLGQINTGATMRATQIKSGSDVSSVMNAGDLTPYSLIAEFVADGSQQAFLIDYVGTGSGRAVLNTVSVFSPVLEPLPEPGTASLSLLGLAAAGWWAALRRRVHRQA